MTNQRQWSPSQPGNGKSDAVFITKETGAANIKIQSACNRYTCGLLFFRKMDNGAMLCRPRILVSGII